MNRWSPLGLLGLAGFCLLATGPAASGQVLLGTLFDDDTGLGIDGASITLFSNQGQRFGSVGTNAEGRFVIDVPRLGDFILEAERIGYRTTRSQSFAVSVLDTLTVSFYVATDVILIDPLVVTINDIRGRDLFTKRVELGKGVLFDPAAVDSLRPEIHPAEILSHAEDVLVRWGWGFYENGRNGPMPAVRAYRGRGGCLHYIVDRAPVPRPWFLGMKVRFGPETGRNPSDGDYQASNVWGVSPLAELTPEDLVAVEVYRHITEVPDDYVQQLIVDNADKRRRLRDMQRGTCGIVIFWTREGW